MAIVLTVVEWPAVAFSYPSLTSTNISISFETFPYNRHHRRWVAVHQNT